jgi:hypothetical protein
MSDQTPTVVLDHSDEVLPLQLAASGVELHGRLQVAASTWFVYGHTSYDGEVVVGRYHDAVEADAALHSVPPHRPLQDRPGP